MAEETVEKLTVELRARLDKFRKDMSGANKLVKQTQTRFSKLRGAVGRVGTRMKSVAGKFRANVVSMKSAIIGLVGGLVLKKIGGFISQITLMGDEIAKTSKKVGIGVETLSGLRLAAELSGSSFQELSGGFRRLSSSASDARDGLAESVRAFERLGVEVTDESGQLRDMESIFFDVADAIKDTSNQTEAAALAQDILGRAGVNLIPLLKGGSAAMREQIKEAKELGIVFSEKDAKAAEEFRDALSRLKFSVIGLGRSLFNELIPVLTTSFAALKDGFVTARSGGEEFATTVAKFVKGLAFTTIGAVELMKSAWSGILIIWNLAQRIFVGLALNISSTLSDILGATAAFVTVFAPAFNKAFNAVLSLGRDFATVVIGIIKGTLAGIIDITAEGLIKLSSLAAEIPGDSAAEFATALQAASGAAREAALNVRDFAQVGQDAVDNFARLEDPANNVATGLLAAQASLSVANTKMKKELVELNAELNSLAESEAIPFWERAKTRILELNDAIAVNNVKLGEMAQNQEDAGKKGVETVASLTKAWSEWFGGQRVFIDEMKGLTSGLWETFKRGAGDAIATAIVAGENLKAAFGSLFKLILKQAISALVQIGVQFLIQAALGVAAASVLGSAQISASLAAVFAGAFAATAVIPIIGPALAPGVAAASLTAATAGTVAAGATGAAIGAIPGAAAGGLVTGPTIVMVGEAGSELIVPLDRVGDMLGGPTTIIIELDGEVLAESVLRNTPDVVRMQVGSEF